MFRLAALTTLALAAAPAAAEAALTVDARSLGGPCLDSRPASAVTASTPWCSLTRAVNAAPAGATVEVRAATYPRVTISGRRQTSPTTFVAAGSERPVVGGLSIASSSNYRFRGFVMTAQSDLTDVSDLRFERNEVALRPAGTATPAGFLVTGARRVAWEGNHIHDGLTGILTRYGGLEDITIKDNRFERLGEDGVFVRFGKRVTIEGNAFTNVAVRSDVKPTAHSDAVQVVGRSEDVRLSDNTVRGGRGFMIQFDPLEFTQAGAAHVRTVVTGNLFTGNDFAIRAYSAPGIRIAGNTAWGPGDSATAGIDVRTGAGVNAKTTGAILEDNVIRRLNVDATVTFTSEQRNLVEKAFPLGRPLGAGSALGTALFVDPAAGDYRQAPGSPVPTAGIGADGAPAPEDPMPDPTPGEPQPATVAPTPAPVEPAPAPVQPAPADPVPAPASAVLTVDARSLGGACSDARPVAAVTPSTPWCSLTRAANAAPAGATVQVRAGTYPRLTISGRRQTSPTTFVAAGSERPVVAGLSLARSSHYRFRGFLMTAQSDLTDVSDLRFEDNEVALVPAGTATPAGFLVTGARRVAWEGNHIHDGLTGILTRYGGLEDITIKDNRFERLGEDGVFVRFGKRVTIEGNAFTNVAVRSDVKPTAHSDAVQVVGSSEDVRLSRNVIKGGRGFMIQFDPLEFTQAGAAHVRTVVTGNLFTGNDFAIRAYSAPGIRIAGNTAWGPGDSATAGIDVRTGAGVNAKTTGAILEDNVIRRLNVDATVTFTSEQRNLVEKAFPLGFDLGAGSRLATAVFVNVAAGDFRQVATSPVPTAGVGTAAAAS